MSLTPVWAELGVRQLAEHPWFWALVLGLIGLSWMIPQTNPPIRRLGAILALAGVVVMMASLVVNRPVSERVISQIVFWFLALITVLPAGIAVTRRNPMYCAIWFALSLLGTGGLFLYQGAQFLGLATVVVYAGAIVVTFLFVIMLAQRRGSAIYDRISWGWYVKPLATLSAGFLLGVVVYTVLALQPEALPIPATAEQLEVGTLRPTHVAGFGAELFARHVISVQVMGILLMVALVGAIAMLSQEGRAEPAREETGYHG